MKSKKIVLLAVGIILSIIVVNYWSGISNIIISLLSIEDTIKNHQMIKKIIFSLNTILVFCIFYILNKSTVLSVKIISIILLIAWLLMFSFHVLFKPTIM